MRRTSAFTLLLAALSGSAQDWNTLGNGSTTFGTNFLGTTNAVEMTIRTYDKVRLVVNQENAYNIGSFTGMPADGFIGISPSSYFWDNGPGPFSRLHLAEPGAAGFHSGGYRPWMRNGISLTGNSDQMYVGQKYTYEEPENPESGEMDDFTDAIIQWSDNPGTWLSDRMRFIFTSEFQNDPTGNGSMEGLEALQLFPDDSGSEVLVGIGDWYAAGVNPDERLDVLDRTIMIRQLPTHYEDTGLDYDKVVVTDDDGRLHWRPVSSLDNCDWDQLPASNRMWTAFDGVGTGGGCPEVDWNVGVGTNNPSVDHKMSIDTDESTSAIPSGIYVHVKGDSGSDNVGVQTVVEPQASSTNQNSTGVSARATNGSTATYGANSLAELVSSTAGGTVQGVRAVADVGGTSSATSAYGVYAECDADGEVSDGWGVYAEVDNAIEQYGVESWANAGTATTVNYGVISRANANSEAINNYGIYSRAYDVSGTGTTATNYGIYARADVVTNGDDYAGWFQGNVWITGLGWVNGTPISSDANLKTNVEAFTGQDAVDILDQLETKSYEYLSEYDYLGVPEGTQVGLMAQEVENIFPAAVASTTVPAQYDDQGVQTHASLPMLGIDYEKFVPVLIAGFQAQQATISDLQDQVEAMQQDLTACCEGRSLMQGAGGASSDGHATGVTELRTSDVGDQRLTITPNPFSEGTVIGYNLPKAGMVSLHVSDASGKSLFNLFEGQQTEGMQRYDWNTSFLAPGMYHVTLLVDGAPLVKKAVKVAR